MSDLYKMSTLREQRSLVSIGKGRQCKYIFIVSLCQLRGRKLTYKAESEGIDLKGWRENVGVRHRVEKCPNLKVNAGNFLCHATCKSN